MNTEVMECTGVVKFYKASEEYGFILRDDPSDSREIYFNKTQVPEDFGYIESNTPVRVIFSEKQDSRLQADRVEFITDDDRDHVSNKAVAPEPPQRLKAFVELLLTCSRCKHKDVHKIRLLGAMYKCSGCHHVIDIPSR